MTLGRGQMLGWHTKTNTMFVTGLPLQWMRQGGKTVLWMILKCCSHSAFLKMTVVGLITSSPVKWNIYIIYSWSSCKVSRALEAHVTASLQPAGKHCHLVTEFYKQNSRLFYMCHRGLASQRETFSAATSLNNTAPTVTWAKQHYSKP